MSHIRNSIVLLLALIFTACAGTPGQRDEVTISIIGTNDVHGALTPDDRVGGIVAVSAYLDALRQARAVDGGAVLMIDAGDMWQGTLESNLVEGAAVVEAYNAMGVTAAAIGNHEFDFGPEGANAIPIEDGEDPRGNLKQRAREADFPLLAANLIDDATGKPVAWDNVQPSIMVEAAGIKIGIVGVMTSNALVTTIAANTRDLSIAPLAETITAEAQRLREDGALLVVVAAHAGGYCADFSDRNDPSSCDMSAEIMRVANRLEPGLVDYIIAGHKHNPIAHIVNGTPITSNYSNSYSFGRVDFRIDPENQRVVSRQVFSPQQTAPGTHASYEGFPLVINPEVERVAQTASARANALKQQKLGVTLTGPFEIVPDIESAISNLMTEAMLDSFDADVAIHNVFGGLRSSLPAGDLTYGAVFQMFPFDNIVTIHEVSGADLRQVIARNAHQRRKPGFAGMRVFVSCDGGQMNVDMQRNDGRKISDDDQVRVIANDFLALGGDDILTPAFRDGDFELRYDMPLARDALVDWFRAGPDTLAPEDFRSHAAPKWNVPDIIPESCQY
ncbi:MAG: bifunctional metallophosphatase/5'-nucleotidase [Gammaproteobacteria bacterium]|nr:bifunctional metallophosphatase/5'-nucleotidase [Gammaproteobacteria bacterium]